MNNDWIIWNGGDCPVSPDTMVQVQFRCDTRVGAETRSENKAKTWDWRADGRTLDIIAYRVVTDPLWVEITGSVDDDGECVFGQMEYLYDRPKYLEDTHRIRIPVKLIDGKRVIDDSRQPVMEKL
jgi:hypothetical protein